MGRGAAVIVVAGALVLAACGGGGKKANVSQSQLSSLSSLLNGLSSDAGNGASSDSNNPFAASDQSSSLKPVGKVRILNAIFVNGQPGPAIDVYDVDKFRIKPSDQPLIKNLKFGEMSDYVSPKGDTSSNLYLFPAGSQTPTDLLDGSNIDNSGFEDGDQLTIALFAAGTGSGTGSVTITEAGSRVNSSVTTAPPPKGTLMIRDATQNPTNIGHYLTIDGACQTEAGAGTGSSTTPSEVGFTAIQGYPVDAGSHTLGVFTSPPGQGVTTCTGQTTTGTTTTNVPSGKTVDVFVFGDPAAPKVIAAPVG